MIVLDDNIDEPDVLPLLKRWAKGKVVFLRELRAGTIIKDEAIPTLLRQQKQPTFVTTNATDFWRRVPADRRYCVICLPLPNERQGEIPAILRRLFRLPDFKKKSARMGKVVYASETRIQLYQVREERVRTVEWE